MPIVVALVEEGKSRLLQRRQVTADRARCHLQVAGKRIDRGAVARRLERVQHLPLPYDFLISRHPKLIVMPKK